MTIDPNIGMALKVYGPEVGNTHVPPNAFMAIGFTLPFVPTATMVMDVTFNSGVGGVNFDLGPITINGQKGTLKGHASRQPFNIIHSIRVGLPQDKSLAEIRSAAICVVAGMSLNLFVDRVIHELNLKLTDGNIQRKVGAIKLIKDLTPSKDSTPEPAADDIISAE